MRGLPGSRPKGITYRTGPGILDRIDNDRRPRLAKRSCVELLTGVANDRRVHSPRKTPHGWIFWLRTSIKRRG